VKDKHWDDHYVVGVNYSGNHDSSLVILNEKSNVLFAGSLERFTRVKQDGRFLFEMLNFVNWDKIKMCAISTDSKAHDSINKNSRFLPSLPPSKKEKMSLRAMHSNIFYEQLNHIPVEKKFICHQRAHAASAAWASPFEEAIVIAYDGGMFNCSSFGGVYEFNRKKGLHEIEILSNDIFKRITCLYTFITALVGFTPNKHEGKVTGIAGAIIENVECTKELFSIYDHHYSKMERGLQWRNQYSLTDIPYLSLNFPESHELFYLLSKFNTFDLCKSTQVLAEKYIRDLILNITQVYGNEINICLAGGLFSNVSINYIISNLVKKEIFVAPFMTDDGSALGAAYEVLFQEKRVIPKPIEHVYFGKEYDDLSVIKELKENRINFEIVDDEALFISKKISEGKIVGRFTGRSEFGPRALGNRSILANPYTNGISSKLNTLLNRSDFMPFAPSLMEEQALKFSTDKVHPSDFYMTRTVRCADNIQNEIVHKDGTARPQYVSRANSSFYRILEILNNKYGIDMVLNTSFNSHEEPIVESPKDAISTFLETEIDFLIMNEKYVISIENNRSSRSKKIQTNAKNNRVMLDFANDFYAYKSERAENS
jgi:carbamoyltransferase